MSAQVLVIAAIAGSLWYVGHETVKGVKALDHKIAHVFHKGKKQQPGARTDETPESSKP